MKAPSDKTALNPTGTEVTLRADPCTVQIVGSDSNNSVALLCDPDSVRRVISRIEATFAPSPLSPPYATSPTLMMKALEAESPRLPSAITKARMRAKQGDTSLHVTFADDGTAFAIRPVDEDEIHCRLFDEQETKRINSILKTLAPAVPDAVARGAP
jgi:hypothetical protein